MNKVIDNIERRIRRNIDFRKEDLKEYVLLCVAYFIAYISIIRADYNYADDIGRKFSGYHGWNDRSRWSTMILSNFIHADWYLSGYFAASAAVILSPYGLSFFYADSTALR